jgi:tRNA(fMet)-specific endonuclease VapC
VRRLSPKSTSYVLDTSVMIDLMDKRPDIQARLATEGATYLTVTALGELFYGALHSAQPITGKADVLVMTQTMTLLVLDGATAELYGSIKHDLRVKGQIIPDNDMWIAATAKQYGLTLAARDAHFARVAGLSYEQW